ncbi:[FeFe] hydrogenase H-cluster maturation GTPase HydF [Fusobacterium sp. PH5-29]|uniref:[FeFe] hydrogenase H-cluster maturation GTPase HydF n=2 Tax=unclassified Fusobacterium TaxID=2648384 RepID=UPI003D1B2A1E
MKEVTGKMGIINNSDNNTLNSVPSGNRVHIGFFGKRNSGKSSLMNAFAGQSISIVSSTLGTTTDPVTKTMEINGIGPCVLIDTAGFDDVGELGELRIQKTKGIVAKIDIAVLLFFQNDIDEEMRWLRLFQDKNIPTLLIISKSDINPNIDYIRSEIKKNTDILPDLANIYDQDSISGLKKSIISLANSVQVDKTILNNLVQSNDVVLLVMPQDVQAPKGRLILPQVQTIRELLDSHCITISVTKEEYISSLKLLKDSPKLIITDSQIFPFVYENKPEKALLTSFSVLFAAYKGDIIYYIKSVKTLDRLAPDSNILIAEACTHAPLTEDIGRIKIPKLLRKKIGESITIDIVNGNDFPQDLTKYDLIIHCGACMFNRKHVLYRIEEAKEQNVPMTNYGILIAYLSSILEKVVF